MIALKIAVLFGSFNPLTNAHVAALQAAVEHLQADKGLFVATNGQYLRRKTVKIGDPFYLSEAERQEAIEAVCADKDKLAFWGFELGGINPSRYRTLCRIGRQYPDAELYEIMGTDKIHTLTKSRHAEDYLSHIRFAVFGRNGADLAQTLAAYPQLEPYADRFVPMPSLGDDAAISSTAVRRRFYAGEDCSAWIPAASAAILARHRPDEFSISFADRMQVLMRSGRFGMRHACREVYADNLALFRRWQATKAGDFAAFLAGAKLYRDGYDVTDVGTRYATTETGCANIDCVDLAELLTARGYNPAILNLASAKRPGGGYDQGFAAQEESLCQMSNLSLSLYQYANPNRIKCVRDSGVPTRCLGYPLDRHFGGIYTPSVTFFRHNRTRYFALRETPFQCDVMTVAALSFNGRTAFSGVEEISFRADDGGFTPEGEAIMLDKIRTIFRMAVEHGKDALVLGAFGCGAYCLPSADVAALFRRVLDEPEFAGKFRLVTFAILEGGRHPRGPEGKFAPFYRIFGTYPVA